MSERPEIIAFIGVIGSGKDHRALNLVDNGYIQINFKDALLDMTSDLVGYDVRKDYEWFKAMPVGMQKPSNPLIAGMFFSVAKELVRRYGIMTGRTLLQRLGTDVMRKRDPEYWAKLFFESVVTPLEDGQSVVCADCRFLNEVECIKYLCGVATVRFIFSDYRSGRYDARSTHESEAMAQQVLKKGFKNSDEIYPCLDEFGEIHWELFRVGREHVEDQHK